MNKILNISLWIIALSLIVVVLGFVNVSKQELTFKKPKVNIDYDTDNRFIDEEDILFQVLNKEDTGSLLLNKFNVAALEEKLVNNHSVKDAQVFKTIDGELVINIKQRRPIVRIFSKNESYYIDDKGFLMPLSNKYTARLLVVSGALNEPYAKRYAFNYNNLPDSLTEKTMLDDVYTIADYIDNSEFWKAQIEQIHVDKVSGFSLIPKVGNHKIVFGGIENLTGKFEKLMIFYNKGLNKTGWNEYSEINLKYKNQVVCTKRYN
ncbi:MAG: cell division protein FtsQ/DivIB [Vicingaceae bacterium]